MHHNKTLKAGNLPVTSFVTMKELLEMAEYLRGFQAKYRSKKSITKKKTK